MALIANPRNAAIAGLTLACLALLALWQVSAAKLDTERAEREQERAELAAQYEREVARLEAVSREVVVQYIPKVEYIRGETRTITKEVPVYVTEQDDRDCGAIPVGFERLHDRAAGADDMPVDHAAGSAHGSARETQIALSDIGRALAINYGSCRENAERLMALQAWAEGIAR